MVNTRSLESIYNNNYGYLKSYDEKAYKVVIMKRVRRPGFELEKKKTLIKPAGITKKMEESISRTKSRIFELALCNSWDYFVTLTINPKKYDRTDLDSYRKDLSQWIRDASRTLPEPIKYILIPELHKDGKSWHMHGFMMGIPQEQISENKNGYKDWKNYSKKFGYISLDNIKNCEACSKYVTKYISKDLEKSVSKFGAKMYYNSHGLKRATILKSGTVSDTIPLSQSYSNEYCSVYWTKDKNKVKEVFMVLE